MRRLYDKLVRDRIPEIIARAGGTCGTTVLDEAAYRAALLAKLVEEAEEVAQADPETLVSELADVLEVVDAVLEAHRLTGDQVRAEQARRRADRGGFRRRLRLLWTEGG